MTIDEFHNWWDILAGAVIGTAMAFSAYRMVYASVWDFRFNHVPLTRHVPFSFGAGDSNAGGFHSAVWTHKAGWDNEGGVFGGAPFDASSKSTDRLGGSSLGNGPGHVQHPPSGIGSASNRRSAERRPIPVHHGRDGDMV